MTAFLMTATTTTSESTINTEIIMLVIGAILGLVASLATIVIERIFDRRGKLNIFYRFCYQRTGRRESWCFEDSVDGRKYFTVPVVYEFQNTSNTTRVIRDVSLLLYKDNKFVAKMTQLDHLHTTTRKGKEVTEEKDLYFGTDKGSYSFVLEPRSIQRQECEYMHIIDPCDVDDNQFDTIKLRYFDERNKEKLFTIRRVDNCWKNKYYDADEEWILVK